MQTHIIDTANMNEHLPLMESYHSLRHRMFKEDKDWAGPISVNDHEFDYWDLPVARATHIITSDDEGNVMSFVRAVSGLHTTMFDVLFSEHLFFPLEKSSSYIELHRYGCDQNLPKHLQKLSIFMTLTTLSQWAVDVGASEGVVFGYEDQLYDSPSLSRAKMIGPIVELEGKRCLAMSLPFSQEIADINAARLVEFRKALAA